MGFAMNKKPTPKAKAPAKKPAPKAAPAPVQKAALKAPGRKPFEAPGTGRKPFERFDDVAADLQEIRLRFIDMHNVRPVLACKGKVTAMESEEIGFLFARVLDDLDMPVPWEYSGFDPYQRDDVPLPDRVDFGPRKQPANEVENALLNAQQSALSNILETATGYENALQLLHASNLSNSDWEIEKWQPDMLETAIAIAQKWKHGFYQS